MSEPLAYPIAAASNLTGLGRTKLYALIADGSLRAVKAGRRTLILSEDLREFLTNLPAVSSPPNEA